MFIIQGWVLWCTAAQVTGCWGESSLFRRGTGQSYGGSAQTQVSEKILSSVKVYVGGECLLHYPRQASRGPQWTPYCRCINRSTLWKKFGGKGKIKEGSENSTAAGRLKWGWEVGREQWGKITEREWTWRRVRKMNASHLLHLQLRPAWRLCVLSTLWSLLLSHVLIWDVNCKYVCLFFRLLAQGLVLNAETSKPGNLGTVAELREDEDEAYFSSYGHYGIHEEMLKVWVVQTHARTHIHTLTKLCRSH